MICPSPMSVPRPGGKGARDRVTVPCGRCGSCLSNKRNEWTFRIMQEWKYAKSAWFITFTYSDLHIPVVSYKGEEPEEFWRKEWTDYNVDRYHPTLRGGDIQKMIRKIRDENKKIAKKRDIKSIPRSYKNWRFRYYIVGEYSPERLRPHYHGLLFNMYPEVIEKLTKYWDKGFIHIGQVNGATIHYTTKYFITNKEDSVKEMLSEQGREKEFTYMSKRPAIGYDWLKAQGLNNKMNGNFRVFSENGRWQKMPRFYREKIFNHNELEQRNLEIEEHIWDFMEKDIKKGGKLIKNVYDKGERIKKKSLKKGQL